MSYTTLISSSQLAAHLNDRDWVIVDCRFDLGSTAWGEEQYRRSHIPGAVYAHLDHDLSSAVQPDVTGRHPLPAIEALARRLSDWGVDERSQVVAYDQNGGMFAARLWWLLRWLGHERVAVLDGGWQCWQGEGGAVDDQRPATISRQFVPRPRPELVVEVQEVIAILQQGTGKLLDARGADRFRGENETIDPVAGHIPGAVSAPFTDNLGPDGCFLDKAQLAARYRGLLGGGTAEQSVVYCGSGVTATHDLLAMLHVGLGEARLYAGSWSHWITDPTRPVATGEG